MRGVRVCMGGSVVRRERMSLVMRGLAAPGGGGRGRGWAAGWRRTGARGSSPRIRSPLSLLELNHAGEIMCSYMFQL